MRTVNRRTRTRRVAALAATALVGGLLIGVPTASAVATTFGPYNIDGVVADSNAGAAIDDPSGSVKELGPLNSSTTKIGVIHNDAVPTLGLTNPNAQVDLTNTWLDLRRVGTGASATDYLYFAWERDSNSGSGFIAYEFMQNAAPTQCAYTTATEAQLTAGCNPFANRRANDFLILWDQQGGSRDLYKRTWSGTGSNLTLGAPVLLGSLAHAEYSPDGFKGEAAVNLTGAGLTGSDPCLTIANTIPSTVTGNSDQADYKDTVLTTRRLTTCAGVNIRKVDDASPAQPLQGAVFTLYVNAAPLAAPRGSEDSITTRTCTTGTDGLCSIDNVPFGEYWVVESTTPPNHDTAADQRVTVASGGSTPALLTFVNPRQRGSILWHKRAGSVTGALLGGAGFTVTGPSSFSQVTPASGAPANTTGLFCIDNLLYGTYTVTETTVPPGYNGADPQTHAVSTKSNCAARLAEVPAATPDLTFVNVPAPGTINILKTDDTAPDANPLPGAQFTLYVDSNGDGAYQATETTVQAGPTPATGSNGRVSFSEVPLGKYCVVETTTPDNHATAGPQCVTIGLGDTAGTGQTISLTFVNPRKHRVIVLVCHEGTDTLLASSVTIGSTTGLTSIAAPPAGTSITQAQLCGLGGATVGGLPHGEVSASANIPTH